MKLPDYIQKEREVMIKGVRTGRKCPPGYDYCWQCGHIALAEVFRENDRCPNPNCPHPEFWND